MNMKRSGISINYPFEWLDETIEVTLNPNVSEADKISAGQLVRIRQRSEQESDFIWSELNNITFGLGTSQQVSVLIRLYHTAIKILEEQAQKNMTHYTTCEQLIDTSSEILAVLQKLKGRIELRYGDFLQGIISEKDLKGETAVKPKLTCKLTVDQIGLILKAADESRLIISSSLSMIFKTLVPYLATELKENLSWDSMRSNAYHPEEKDKAAAIAALEKLIKKIEGF